MELIDFTMAENFVPQDPKLSHYCTFRLILQSTFLCVLKRLTGTGFHEIQPYLMCKISIISNNIYHN